MMKSILSICVSVLMLAVSCSDRRCDYDSGLCDRLAVKVERQDSISQDEYRQMIGQCGQILAYIVERGEALESLPDDRRYRAYRELLADPQYMERFSYLFTLGSALYQADAAGRLDKGNKEAYEALDEYNERFSDISDRL